MALTRQLNHQQIVLIFFFLFVGYLILNKFVTEESTNQQFQKPEVTNRSLGFPVSGSMSTLGSTNVSQAGFLDRSTLRPVSKLSSSPVSKSQSAHAHKLNSKHGVTITTEVGPTAKELMDIAQMLTTKNSKTLPTVIPSFEIETQILNQPAWIHERSWGISRNGDYVFKQSDVIHGADDREEEYSWKHFFNGTTNGLILELGGMDGSSYSVSKFYEQKAGWKSILIEGSPQALEIPKNRPKALSLHLAICHNESIVHFRSAGGGVGGVLEFMSPIFLKMFHKSLLKGNLTGRETNVMDMLDWNKVKAERSVIETPCVSLQRVLDRFAIRHINLMVLDLEGGELGALMSLDFSRIQFDVICVETNRFQNFRDPHIDQVVNFLLGKSYKLFKRTEGRNSWFVAQNWTTS